jgi:hypothetical protein
MWNGLARPVPAAVIPAKAGIQCFQHTEKGMDPRLRGDDFS